LQDPLERLRRVRNNCDRVRLLRNQLQNNVGLLLRVSIVRAGHGGVNPILRRELLDPLLHTLKPPDPSSLDDRDDPDLLRLRMVWVASAALSTCRRRNHENACQAGNDDSPRSLHYILNDLSGPAHQAEGATT